jgi:hypothetical protein
LNPYAPIIPSGNNSMARSITRWAMNNRSSYQLQEIASDAVLPVVVVTRL